MSKERRKMRAEERDRRRGRGETLGGFDSSSPEPQPRAGASAHPSQGYDRNVGYSEYRPGEAASLSQDPVSGASGPHRALVLRRRGAGRSGTAAGPGSHARSPVTPGRPRPRSFPAAGSTRRRCSAAPRQLCHWPDDDEWLVGHTSQRRFTTARCTTNESSRNY